MMGMKICRLYYCASQHSNVLTLTMITCRCFAEETGLLSVQAADDNPLSDDAVHHKTSEAVNKVNS